MGLIKSLVLASAALGASALPTRNSDLVQRDLGGNNTLVQLFEWNWASVARECPTLAQLGYGYAQVSPPQEHVSEGTQWWTDYQPVSYTIQSKRGSRAQFQAMTSACNSVGVKIIVDTVINHMTGSDRPAGVGTAGNSYSSYSTPAVPYGQNDFHSPCSINYGDANSVWTCQLSALEDLKTETDYVRGKIAGYMNDLLSLGASGFRVDAEKHIPPADMQNIVSRLTRPYYLVGEVNSDNNQPVTPSLYTGIGNVHEFRAQGFLQSAFLNGGISNLLNSFPGSDWVTSNKAAVFVANHDTERGSGAIRWDSPNNAYVLANVFLLGQDYGQPNVLSGYTFTNTDDGSPQSNGISADVNCASAPWRCEHRWPAIAGMVRFHNAAGTTAMSRKVSSSSNRISFSRGSVGSVVINRDSSSWTTTVQTDVPAGTYCNVINNCANSITVSGGSFTVTVGAYDAVAFYVGGGKGSTTTTTSSAPAPTGGSGTVVVSFAETATTSYGQGVYLVGSSAQLGSWSTSNAIALTRDAGTSQTGVWRVSVTLPASQTSTYKFVKLNNSDRSLVAWESDPNRSLTTNASGTQTVTTTWR